MLSILIFGCHMVLEARDGPFVRDDRCASAVIHAISITIILETCWTIHRVRRRVDWNIICAEVTNRTLGRKSFVLLQEVDLGSEVIG